jgi:drug/metabolite transporter (DMT)-like permease
VPRLRFAHQKTLAELALNAIRNKTLGSFAALGLIGLCALWGLGQVAIKIGNAGISPILQAGLRSAGAAILLALWCKLRGIALWRDDRTAGPGVAAGVLFAIEFLLLYWGLEYTTAARSVVFLNTSPFFVALGAHFVLANDRLTPAKTFGLLAAFVGVAIAFADGFRAPTTSTLIGDAMALGAAIAWGATTVLVKGTRLARIEPERTLMYQLVVSAGALIVTSFATGERGIFDPTPLVLSALGYQVIVVAFASYLLWFWFIKHYPASQVSSFVFLTPVFGVIAGAMLLHEPITPRLIVALALIAFGIYMTNRPPRAQPTSATIGND